MKFNWFTELLKGLRSLGPQAKPAEKIVEGTGKVVDTMDDLGEKRRKKIIKGLPKVAPIILIMLALSGCMTYSVKQAESEGKYVSTWNKTRLNFWDFWRRARIIKDHETVINNDKK